MENIYIVEKNLFESDAPVFCHQVNCLGVWGSGIAKSMREIFPDVYEKYRDICVKNEYLVLLGHTAIIQHSQNAKYLAYYFHTSMFLSQKRKLAHGTKVIEVTPDKLNDVIISLPTLEKQKEIVEVLDRFDTLCNDLTTGLPAEIEARQKQYEYYRDKLLSFKKKEVSNNE